MPSFFESLTNELSSNPNVLTFSDVANSCKNGVIPVLPTRDPVIITQACVGSVSLVAVDKMIDAGKDIAKTFSSSPKNK